MLLDQIIRRVTGVLRRHGRLDDDAIDPEPEQLLLFAARFPLSRRGPSEDEEVPPLCARREGFSLHAGRAVHANDREGLERLCAYASRPPLAQGRLSLTDDGQVLYRMKRTFSDGTRELRFTVREFVARLCALVPPPRFHQVRYAGIFAAHARGRYALTGRGLHDQPPDAADGATPGAASAGATSAPGAPAPPAAAAPFTVPAAPGVPATAGSSNHAVDPRRRDAEYRRRDAEHRAGRDRWRDAEYLAGPDDPARARRLAWSDLFQRVWREDVFCCSKCGGEMRLIAVIQEPAVCEKILRHVGLWQRGPPRGRSVVAAVAGRDLLDAN